MISGLLFASMIIAIGGGIIRGVTGFGGSLVMTPALTLMFDPKAVIPTVLLLETIAAAPMLRAAIGKAEFRIIVPICLAAFITVPLGGYLLVAMDPAALRRWIAGTVIVFSALLLAKIRYTGPRSLGASVAAGGLSGILLGSTGIGGPPVILFLLSGQSPIDIARANLTLTVSVISIAGLAMLWFRDILDFHSAVPIFVLGPCFYLGIMVGMRLFRRISERRFRQLTLLLLIAVSLAALLR